MSTRSMKRRLSADSDLDGTPAKRRRLTHNSNNKASSKPKLTPTPTKEGQEDEDFDFDFDDADDDTFNQDNGNWDGCDLNYGQESIKSSLYEKENLSQDELLKLALEKRRIANADKSKFWKCGKTDCEFLNHPSRAICMSCCMPEMDIIRYLLNCTEKLKQCTRCNAYVIPKQYEDHELDCNPLCNDKKISDSIKKQWYVDLTQSEKNAIQHVTNEAFNKSSKEHEKVNMVKKIQRINKESEYLFGKEDEAEMILMKLLKFLEWKVPIIIHVHCANLIPKLLEDTHYRNLFETGYGSGNTDQSVRKREETKMFGEVYFGVDGIERPKYGCLNVNLKDEGCKLANQYGDGYFVMNNTTIRWRVTMTIKDSFAVNGNCGTLKHNLHLLNQLSDKELKQMIQVAMFGKHNEKDVQSAYREIQIHGPIQLNRDIYSFHVPDKNKNREQQANFELFCQRNDIKLVWF